MLNLFHNLRSITRNPVVFVIKVFLSKWYFTIATAGLIVVFSVYSGLNKIGVIQEAEKIIITQIKDAKSIARYCIPQIIKLSDFWNCLEDPPEYQASKIDNEIESAINQQLKAPSSDLDKNPYAD